MHIQQKIKTVTLFHLIPASKQQVAAAVLHTLVAVCAVLVTSVV
jgi:hypothetical protein